MSDRTDAPSPERLAAAERLNETPEALARRLAAASTRAAPVPERKVYAVVAGEYSDWRIESVWSTREFAEAELARHAGAHDDYEIEEYAIDAEVPLLTVTIWVNRDGRVFVGSVDREHETEYAVIYRSGNDDPQLQASIRAVDVETAVRAAQEMRRRFLAANAWVHGARLENDTVVTPEPEPEPPCWMEEL